MPDSLQVEKLAQLLSAGLSYRNLPRNSSTSKKKLITTTIERRGFGDIIQVTCLLQKHCHLRQWLLSFDYPGSAFYRVDENETAGIVRI